MSSKITDSLFLGASWLENIQNQHFNWYMYWLIILSLFVYSLEIVFPWRKNQAKIRKDFWLDTFYMYFNLFLFPLIIFKFAAQKAFNLTSSGLEALDLDFLISNRVGGMPFWLQILLLFLVRDFTQWNIHRLLHRVPFLWNFHKVHHSVKEMGFAAHLRFHWMESVIYNTIQFIPLALLGFTLDSYIAVYVFTILIGHLNHANLKLPLGPLRYIFNNPQMHIWHHARKIPQGQRFGCNYGLSLSIWDYLFKTASIPRDGRDEELGFDGDEKFPKGFSGQILYGFKKDSDKSPS